MATTLVLYHSVAGTSSELAELVMSVLLRRGHQVALKSPSQVTSLTPYGAVVLVYPIRFGKPPQIIEHWLAQHLPALVTRPTALACTCLRLTSALDAPRLGYRCFVDAQLAEEPRPQAQMSMLEKTHAEAYYLQRLYHLAPRLKPVSIGFFKGRLDFGRLGLRGTTDQSTTTRGISEGRRTSTS